MFADRVRVARKVSPSEDHASVDGDNADALLDDFTQVAHIGKSTHTHTQKKKILTKVVKSKHITTHNAPFNIFTFQAIPKPETNDAAEVVTGSNETPTTTNATSTAQPGGSQQISICLKLNIFNFFGRLRCAIPGWMMAASGGSGPADDGTWEHKHSYFIHPRILSLYASKRSFTA